MIVPVDKPSGPTSAQAVRRISAAAGVPAGHAGTLDPGATGLLVVCLGEARKLTSLLAGHDKAYRATVRLGTATDTLDAWGRVVGEGPVPPLDAEAVGRAAQGFVGRIRQQVPAFSAVKRDGRPLHRDARKGRAVEAPEREVEIRSIRVVSAGGGSFEMEVECAAGTYIRSLARDMAAALGTCGHVAALRRVRSGPLSVEGAPGLDEAVEMARAGRIAEAAVPHLAAIAGHRVLLAGEAAERDLRQGKVVGLAALALIEDGLPPCVVIGDSGRAVCVAVEDASGAIRPRRVLL